MKRDQKVALMFGLAGAIPVVMLIVVVGYFGYRGMGASGSSIFDDRNIADKSGASRKIEKIDGPKAWHQEAEKYMKELADSGLEKRYEIVSATGSLYKKLYKDKDFDAVEKALKKKLLGISDPWEAYEYGSMVTVLSDLKYDFDPEEVRQVLKKWTDEQPESHFAWMLRGSLAVNYGWYWRGGGYAESITEEGSAKFHEALYEAHGYLDRAYSLDPNDPEISFHQLWFALGANLPKGEFDQLFDRVVTLVPSHYGAHSMKLDRLYPKWHGSWEQVDEFLAECDMKSREQGNPMLRQLKYWAYDEMRVNRPGYEDVFKRSNVQTELLSTYKDMMAAWPDKPITRSNYARVLYIFGRYEQAHEQFETLGDVYYNQSLWWNLASYNRCRAWAVYQTGYKRPAAEQIAYFRRAIEIDPKRDTYYIQTAYRCQGNGDVDGAIAILREGIEANVEGGDIWLQLAVLYRNMNRSNELIELLDKSKAFSMEKNRREQLDKMEVTARAAREAK